jgi:hypothetical protein
VKRLLAAMLLAACRSAPALDSCADDLGGVWRVDEPGALATTPSGEPRRYHLVDTRAGVELYAMFDDSVLAPGDRKETTPDAVIVAPSMLDLGRVGNGALLVGKTTRRFERGARTCTLHTPARIERCTGDRLELRATAIGPPADWDRCALGPGQPETLVLHRERD